MFLVSPVGRDVQSKCLVPCWDLCVLKKVSERKKEARRSLLLCVFGENEEDK